MNELWYIIAIGFLSLASTIISSKGSLYDKRRRWYSRLTKRGKFVVAIGLFIILLSFLQFRKLQESDNQKDALLKKERDARDSIISARIAAGVDSSSNKLFNDLSIAFANQNLLIDTVKKRIESLRDSAKTVIINASKDLPRLIIRDDGIVFRQTRDTLYVDFAIVSTQAEARLNFIDYILKKTILTGRLLILQGRIYTVKQSICPRINIYIIIFI